MEPQGEIKGENITRVSHAWHEVKEVMVFHVVVLQMLYHQHPAAVDKIHLKVEVCVRPTLDAPSAPVKTAQTPPTPTIPLYLNLVS